jgi:hypothetical protein
MYSLDLSVMCYYQVRKCITAARKEYILYITCSVLLEATELTYNFTV